MTQLTSAQALPAPSRALAAVVAGVAGLLLAILWSYEFVDTVVGEGIRNSILDGPVDATVVSGALIGGLVTGLAGTFTACNVACFATMAPLARPGQGGDAALSRTVMLRHVAGRLALLAAGMATVAFAYGIFGVVAAEHLPQLSEGQVGSYPARLVQATVINGLLGIAFVALGLSALAGRGVAATGPGMVAMGALLGLLLVGRPYPMFQELFAEVAATGNVFVGGAVLVVVALGNIAIMAVLVTAMILLAGPAIGRRLGASPSLSGAVTGTLLLGLGVFSVVYWVWRVPALFTGTWFPSL